MVLAEAATMVVAEMIAAALFGFYLSYVCAVVEILSAANSFSKMGGRALSRSPILFIFLYPYAFFYNILNQSHI